MNWEQTPFDRAALKEYLVNLYGEDVQVINVFELTHGEEEQLKEFGYGVPLLIEFTHQGEAVRAVLHTLASNEFGHERASDRACNILLDHATFNQLPRHVRSLDVGTFTRRGKLLSLGEWEEFFHLTHYAPGQPYADDLKRIARMGAVEPVDRVRVRLLADYLAQIHAVKRDDPARYRRRVRDLLGHGEGIMGMTDSYPPDCGPAPPARLEEIEKQCVGWRWRIKGATHRLSQVHGDFHPWNVLFQDGGELALLDRSRGAWGEPGDDLSAMTINYILFSLRQHGTFREPFTSLFRLLWERYLNATEDEEMLSVIQPFYAWRALVVAHPRWYPSLSDSVRETLLRFLENVLSTDRFDPFEVERYLEQK